MKIQALVCRRVKNILYSAKKIIFLVLTFFLGVILWTIYSQTIVLNQSKIHIEEEIVFNETSQCTLQWKSQLSENPVIKLNSAKFILPLLINESNDQMVGFRDAIFLSIALNRTLIMPRFYQHKSRVIIEPELKVNMYALSSFLSVKRHSELYELCHGEIGVLFITDHSAFMTKGGPPYNKLANLTGIKNLSDAANSSIHTLPTSSFFGLKQNQGTVELMRKLYSANERCALYVHPYRSVGVRESASGIRNARKLMSSANPHVDVDKIDPELLYSLVFINSPKPLFVQQIANDFRTQALENQTFIAVHWRFDKEDWMLKCSKQDKSDGEKNFIDICEKVEMITAYDIARGIEQYHKHIEQTHHIKANSVYFAAPLNLQKLVDDVEYYIVTGNTKVQFYSSFQAEIHVKQYPGCSFFSEHSTDILSSLEMDICLYSDSFLSSDTSTWSLDIVIDRNASRRSNADGSALDIAWKAYEIRTNRASVHNKV